MSTLDRQRIAAVRTLESLGYGFDGTEWMPPPQHGLPPAAAKVTDALLALLLQRADALAGCTEDSEEAAELAALVDAIDAYELVRWPQGRIPGGKG